MNENDDEVSIPLTVDTDQARANINGLREDAQALDDTLLELRQRGTEVFNQAPEGKQRPARSYDEVEQRTSQYAPDLYAEQNPEMARIQAGIAARQDAIDARLRDFVQARPDATTLSGGAFYQAYGAWSETAPPTRAVSVQPLPPPASVAPTPGAMWPATFAPGSEAPPAPASATAVGGAQGTPTSAAHQTAAQGGLSGEALTRLRGDAEALDPDLQKRETQATRLFNALKMPGDLTDPKPLKAADYDDVRAHLAGRSPEDVWGQSPALHQAVMGAEDRRATIGAQVNQFAGTPAFGTATTALAPEFVPTGVQPAPLAQPAQSAQPAPLAQPAQPAPGTQSTTPHGDVQGSAPADLYRTFSAWLTQQQTAGGASAQAQGRASSTTAWGGGTSSPSPFAGGGTAQDTDRTATTFAERIATAVAHSGGSVAASLTRGAFDAAGMGAAGDVVSGLAGPVAGALGELFAPVAGALAAVGVGLGINSQASHYFGEEQTLAGGVGSRGGATPSSELTVAQQTGWGFQYHEKESVAAARQLGDAGVDSSQLGGTLSASMALARVGGMDLGTTTQLSGQYARAGFSGSQISDTYAELDRASRLTGVSISRVTSALKELNQTAGLGAIGVTSLAATQALAGPEVNVGQALAPAIGAQGAEAIQMQAMLGLSPQAFLQAQRRPDQLWDAYAGVAKRFDRGTYGTDVAEQALKTAGLDLSSLKGPDAAAVVQRLVSQGPKAAEDYYTSLQTKEKAHPETGTTFDQKGVDAANRQTAATEKAAIALEQWTAAVIRADGQLDNSQQGRDEQKLRAALAHHDEPAANKARLDLVRDTAPGAGSPDPTKAEAYRQRLLDYQAHTDPLGYASNPGAAGTMDASTGRGFGPIPEYQLSQYRQSGLKVGGSYLNADTFHDYEMTARRTGVPLAVLLAQGQAESGFNPGAIQQGGNGRGIAQFDFTPGANAANSAHWLGEAEKKLGYGAGEDPRQAAMDPRIATMAQGLYMASLGHASHGNWQQALTSYNGSGPAAQQYGHDTYTAAQKVEIQIGGTVTLTHPNGTPAGTGQVKPQTHTITHPVDHGRKPKAHQSYGPTDHTPPAPPPRFHRFG